MSYLIEVMTNNKREVLRREKKSFVQVNEKETVEMKEFI
jgi:hypothetical protein